MPDEKYLYPEPPPMLARLRLRGVLAFLGPGIILASVTIGSGELVLASRSGAIFGYSMLWCFLYAGVFKAIQVYAAARHMTLTGEHPLVAWSIPRRFPIFPLLIAVPAILLMPIAFSGIPEMLGGFIHRLVGMEQEGAAVGRWDYLEFWINVWSSLVLIGCVSLALYSDYTLLERISTFVLAIMVGCIAIAVITFGPDLGQLFKGLVYNVSEFPTWVTEKYPKEFARRTPWVEIALYLSAVGGGAYDYIGYIGMLREKKWGLAGRRVAPLEEMEQATANSSDEVTRENLRRARIWQRAPFLDTTISFVLVILVTLLFAILAAMVLNTAQVVPANNDLLNEQQRFVTELHPRLLWVYRVGVFCAFIGTVYGAFEVYRHTFIESIQGMVPELANVKEKTKRTWGYMIMAYCFFGGLTMIWLPEAMSGSIVKRMTFGAIVTGATSCGLWCFAMLIADQIRMPKPLRMSPLLRIATLIAGVSMFCLGVRSIVSYFSS